MVGKGVLDERVVCRTVLGGGRGDYEVSDGGHGRVRHEKASP